MPITEELKNVKKFESVGFTHEQAEVLAESLEDTVKSGTESLKEFINDKINNQTKDIQGQFKDIQGQFKDIQGQFKDIQGQFKEVRNEMKLVKVELKTDIVESSKDLLIKISIIITAIVTTIVGSAVAIIKLV